MKTAWSFKSGRQVADRNGLVARSPRTNGGILSKNFIYFATMAGILFFAFVATAQTNGPSDAETQGQRLAQELCNTHPAQDFTNSGVLKIISGDKHYDVPIHIFTKIINPHSWEVFLSGGIWEYHIVHTDHELNEYFDDAEDIVAPLPLTDVQKNTPFAGSDFWIYDLGLEFLHWPEQKVIKKEFMRGRGCMVLESTNPSPTPNGYSRVDSWIDEETLGIVHAEAYDKDGKLLKVFDPKSFKKVNGQWELQDMEIKNVQTGSRTRIEFDLGK